MLENVNMNIRKDEIIIKKFRFTLCAILPCMRLSFDNDTEIEWNRHKEY